MITHNCSRHTCGFWGGDGCLASAVNCVNNYRIRRTEITEGLIRHHYHSSNFCWNSKNTLFRKCCDSSLVMFATCQISKLAAYLHYINIKLNLLAIMFPTKCRSFKGLTSLLTQSAELQLQGLCRSLDIFSVTVDEADAGYFWGVTAELVVLCSLAFTLQLLCVNRHFLLTEADHKSSTKNRFIHESHVYRMVRIESRFSSLDLVSDWHCCDI